MGKKLSEERRKQITEQVRGRKLKPRTEEHCRRLSISHLGQKAWNKGMQNIYSEESLQKMRDAKKGNNWNIGNKMSQESIDKMSKDKKGKITWNKGLKYKILKYHSDINMN